MQSPKVDSKTPMRMLAVILLLAAACGPLAAFADSSTVSYQGSLRNPTGAPISDGTYPMMFTIYDAVTAGASLWTETQPLVAIKDGLFSVQLGSVTPLGALFTSHSAVWLEIAANVSGSGFEAYGPRVTLSSAPYAKQADNAATADSAANATHASSADTATNAGHASTADSATSATNATNATNAANATNATNATNADNANTVDNLQASAFWGLAGNAPGASDFLGTTNAADLVIKTNGTEKMRVQSGGNVGIGKTPTTTLDVAGGIKSTMWKLTKAIAYGGGPYPRSGSFTSAGGTLMICASASAFNATAGTTMEVDLYLDNVKKGALIGFTNEASSHKALVPDVIVLTGIAAGTHTVDLRLVLGSGDFNDYSEVAVMELPF